LYNTGKQFNHGPAVGSVNFFKYCQLNLVDDAVLLITAVC